MHKILTLAAVAAALLGGTADARRHSSGHHSYHHSYHARSHHARVHRYSYHSAPHYYRAHSGHYVHRPMHADSRPAGATARCRDGSWSFSESRRGTCSWHGGVAAWVH
ncbi:MAG: DUF3761 domain-containing protein [Alphaproteobacteria bacterium]|nr:DUF3761 domain-containing protein [Alphaproteobacteria bacterium]